MKGKFSLMLGAALASLVTSAGACTFSWQHYGDEQVFKKLQQGIGAKVTDRYCQTYNKTHQIVIWTDAYNNPQRTLAHVAVGLRKRGTKDIIANSFTAYRFEDGNFVVGRKYEMAAALALDTLMDVMSDLDSYAN